MTSYVGPQLELYEECLQLVPAILKAKHDGRTMDAFELYKALLEEGDKRRLSREETWSTFSTAAMAWVTQLFHGAAARSELDFTTLIDDAIAKQALRGH